MHLWKRVQGSQKLRKSRWSCLLDFDRTLTNKRCINSMKHLESTLSLGQGRSLPPYCPLYEEMAGWPTENLGWQKFALIIISFDQPGLQHLGIIHQCEALEKGEPQSCTSIRIYYTCYADLFFTEDLDQNQNLIKCSFYHPGPSIKCHCLEYLTFWEMLLTDKQTLPNTQSPRR